MGDFNFPDINWFTLSGSSTPSSIFCDFLFDHNLHQLVTSPTHSKGNILDLVITNHPDIITNISIDSRQELLISSDHFPILFSIPFNTKSNYSPPQYILDYSKADWEGLLIYLLDFDFTDFYSSDDIEYSWNSLKSTIINASSLFIPKIRLHSHQRPKWFTKDIQHHINQIHTLRRKYRSRFSPSIKAKLDTSEKHLQDRMIQSKATYENNLVKNFAFNNDHQIFKYINSITSRKQLPATIHLGSASASSDSEKAALFNLFFNSTFTSSSNSSSLNGQSTTKSTLSTIHISDTDVYEALLALNTTKSKGIDGISPKILSRCASALSQPIHHLFIRCLIHHSLPSEWRIHLISPIPKSGDLSSVTNYRPISLLCVISKVLERLIYDKIIDFVSTSISNNQFGFLNPGQLLNNCFCSLTLSIPLSAVTLILTPFISILVRPSIEYHIIYYSSNCSQLVLLATYGNSSSPTYPIDLTASL